MKKTPHITFTRTRCLLLSLYLLIQVAQLNAQSAQYGFESYSMKEGLSRNFILSIAQDKRGFMWFGTEDGLNRFDGHDFRIFRHKDNDPNTIVSNSVRVLFIDDDNSIWIGTDNGVCRILLDTEQIQHYPVDFTDETKLNGSHVSAIKKHKDGSIWISYIGSGIDIIQPGKQEIFHYTIHREDEFKLQNDMVSTMLFLPDAFTLIGTYSGLQFLDPAGRVLSDEQARQKYPWKDALKLSIKTLYLSKDNKTLWVGTEVSGAFKIDLSSNTIQNFTPKNSELTSSDILTIREDYEGSIWIGSDALYRYNKANNTLQWFNEYGMYVKNHINALFEDRDLNFWMGTTRLGARKFNNNENQLRHFHANQGEDGLKSDEILSFNEDLEGNIWVGTGGAGLARMQRDLKSFTQEPVNNKLFSQVIKTIHRDGEGNFWMGGWDAGLIKFNPQNKHLEQLHPDKGTFSSRHIWDIAEDQQGNLWLATLRDGLCRFSPKTKEITYYKHNPVDANSLLNNDVQGVHVDKNNVLWVATSNGISVLLPGATSFTNSLKFKTNNENALSNSVLISLFEDHQGRMWLGSKGGGITLLRLVNNKMIVEQQIKEIHGLPSNIVTAMQEDAHHNVWVSTAAGMAKLVRKEEGAFEVIPLVQLQGVEFLAQASLKSSSGEMLFGGSSGFYFFHPDSIKLAEQQIDVLFTSLKIINDEIKPNTRYRDRIILEKSITDTDVITLSHEDYAFTLTFAPVIYHLQKNIHYAYKLENLDKEWQYTRSDRRFVHYTNLAPGTYVLKVKASLDGTNWHDAAKELTIHVAPPWWAAFWFKLSVAMILGGVIFSIYQARINFVKKQRNRLEKLVVLRTRELRRSNDEINKLLKEVAEQKRNIENNNEELQQINEALGVQRDTLEVKSFELEKAQYKLREINTSLENLVNKRTQKLNETLHELETFLYRASHDLRGPISSMLGLLEVSKLEASAGAGTPTYANYFSMAVFRLERSLQKLLQKYTIQKDDPRFENISRTEMEQLVFDVTDDIKCFRKKDFSVSLKGFEEFQTDKAFLYIVLLSLLENAFFFSEKSLDPRVSLQIIQGENTTSILVTDWGIGIKNEHKDLIYTMFYRGSVRSTGNGLGLYLVKSAVEKLNGTISLETEVGKFSQFTVILPNTPKSDLSVRLRQEIAS